MSTSGRKKTTPNNVFFLFSVEDIERARAFMAAPDAGVSAQESGVVEGEYHFVEGQSSY